MTTKGDLLKEGQEERKRGWKIKENRQTQGQRQGDEEYMTNKQTMHKYENKKETII